MRRFAIAVLTGLLGFGAPQAHARGRQARAQVGLVERGSSQRRPARVDVVQAGGGQVGLIEARGPRVREGQLGARQARPDETPAAEQRARQISSLEPRPVEPVALPELRVIARPADGGALVHVPRYQAFQDHALALARGGARFREIAGNRGDILVSALVPRGYRPASGAASLLFAQPVLTQPGTERLLLTVPVPELHAVLPDLATPPRRLEHVYDY